MSFLPGVIFPVLIEFFYYYYYYYKLYLGHGRIISKNFTIVNIYKFTVKLFTKNKEDRKKNIKKTLIYMIAVCESVEANQLFKPLLKTLRDCADRS